MQSISGLQTAAALNLLRQLLFQFSTQAAGKVRDDDGDAAAAALLLSSSFCCWPAAKYVALHYAQAKAFDVDIKWSLCGL